MKKAEKKIVYESSEKVASPTLPRQNSNAFFFTSVPVFGIDFIHWTFSYLKKTGEFLL